MLTRVFELPVPRVWTSPEWSVWLPTTTLGMGDLAMDVVVAESRDEKCCCVLGESVALRDGSVCRDLVFTVVDGGSERDGGLESTELFLPGSCVGDVNPRCTLYFAGLDLADVIVACTDQVTFGSPGTAVVCCEV